MVSERLFLLGISEGKEESFPCTYQMWLEWLLAGDPKGERELASTGVELGHCTLVCCISCVHIFLFEIAGLVRNHKLVIMSCDTLLLFTVSKRMCAIEQ